MKRDLSLIRAIMLRVEAAPARNHLNVDALADLHDDSSVVSEHVELMAEAGLLSVTDTYEPSSPYYLIHRLTWAGHEFLDATRDEAVWKKVTERVLKTGASWTFDIVKEWAKHELRTRLGLPG
jgi:hypothetical protein